MSLIPIYIHPHGSYCGNCPFRKDGECTLFNSTLEKFDSGNGVYYERCKQCHIAELINDEQST